MPVRSVFLCLCAAMALMGCATDNATNAESNPDPLDAAQRAFDHDDWQLMALPAITTVIPGVKGDDIYLDNVKKKFGLRYTQGTASGDVQYAETYNRRILDLRGCNPSDPMARCKR